MNAEEQAYLTSRRWESDQWESWKHPEMPGWVHSGPTALAIQAYADKAVAEERKAIAADLRVTARTRSPNVAGFFQALALQTSANLIEQGLRLTGTELNLDGTITRETP
jgi:hypothetical protein